MSVTIDSLDIQIAVSAGSAEQKIKALSTALGELRGNAKLTQVTNNLHKLAGALGDIQSKRVNSGALKDLAAVMNGLAGIQKLTGLNSAINSLKQIPKVIDALDVATLDKFANRMDRLVRALNPVAKTLDKVGSGFAKLPTNINKAVSATNKMKSATTDMNEALDTSGVSLMATISNFGSYIDAINRVVQAMSNIIAQAIEWDGIQFRFGRAFGEDAEEVYQYVQKLNDVMGINIQQFMQYSSLYGSLLKGFGLAQEKVTTMSVGLTELSYDIWAAYNDRYKTLEDASEAVRSAITGEIEPIRNAGIALTEASLQEFIDSTHLAGISIEKLSEAQKAEVRYAAMMDAAMKQGIVGTYAREIKTAEGAVRDLTQGLKTLTQAFGSLFIPLLQLVVPYVTAFVEILTDAVFWVASLFGIELFAIDWSSANSGIGGMADSAESLGSGLDDAADSAKKLKNYTMGFDELNVIDPNSGSGSKSGGAGSGLDGWGSGLDLSTMWDQDVLDEAARKVDEIKQKILDFFDKWKWAIAGIVAALAALAVIKHWGTIVGWATKIGTALANAVELVKAVWGAFKGSAAAQSALTFMSPMLANIVAWLKSAAGFLATISGPTWLAIAAGIAAVASVAYFLYQNWEEVTAAVKRFFAENIAPKLAEMKEHFIKMKDAVVNAGKALLDMLPEPVKVAIATLIAMIKTVATAFLEWAKSVDWLEGLGTVIEFIGGVIFSVISGGIMGAFNAFITIIENLVQIFSGMVSIISNGIIFIVSLFKGDLQQALDAWEGIWNGILDVGSGLTSLVTDLIWGFVTGIIDWFVYLWDELVGHSIVPDMVEAIIDWFLSLPKAILKPIQDFIDDILSKFEKMWSDLKSWYHANLAPKFTAAYWKNVFNQVVTGISNKLSELKGAIASKWNTVKDWYNQEVAPKLKLSYWANKVSDFLEVGRTIMENIKKGLKEKWNEIKEWWSKLELPEFKIKMPHIEWSTSEAKGWIADTLAALGLPTAIPKLEVSWYAAGGFPEMGELFVAREAGPEMVGSIGGRTAVANNDQIVEAISQGVYSAVMAAMAGQQSGEQAVNVYLDGKQIYTSVKKRESQMGRTLMGNQLGYTY